jgi:2-amino-4-hydroxy-6-hydroxymethyldihydropteridine diphosphokinase
LRITLAHGPSSFDVREEPDSLSRSRGEGRGHWPRLYDGGIVCPMRTSPSVTAYLGLGANLGDREHAIRSALAKLAQTPHIEFIRSSKLLENPAVGGPVDSPPFLNAAAEIRTTLGAHALLNVLLEIERSLRRTRREKWAPRTIDLDILLFGDQILSSNDLVVPHPLMHERRFVLQPLAEIAPEAVHPVLQMTIAGLLKSLAA